MRLVKYDLKKRRELKKKREKKSVDSTAGAYVDVRGTEDADA
jgi:hypothetical protein